ncbi:MAG: LysM peptidoglycan-binding domain-containing protein [Planctomycetes bacterium]|nr:LysM peptidoglycan-binding domain-containing protein [Planctomycetota bacterium]
MGTGAKIGVVLALMLVVIAFVRYLDRDIQEGTRPETSASDEHASDSPTGFDSQFAQLGVEDAAKPQPVQAEPSSRELAMRDAESNAGSEPISLDSVRSAGLRPVSADDRIGGVSDEPEERDEDPIGRSGRENPGFGGGSAEDLFDYMQGNRSGDLASRLGGVQGPDDSDSSDHMPPATRPVPEADGERAATIDRLLNPSDDGAADDDGASEDHAPRSDSGSPRVARDEPRVTPTPVDRRPAPVVSDSGLPATHTVTAEDTLWDLAAHYYGKPLLYKKILEANPSLGDGAVLKLGSKLTIPALSAGEAGAAATPIARRPDAEVGTYRVVKGDSLYRIAQRELGDGGRWKDIARANPDVDPDHLKVGAVLRLPK